MRHICTTPGPTATGKAKRGRSSELIDRRNAALMQRYYFWTEVQRLRFDDVLKILSRDEFFLSEERILRIIRHESALHPKPAEQSASKIRKPRITHRQRNLLEQ